jgi:type I restriction-modification system DNA methylase subunit
MGSSLVSNPPYNMPWKVPDLAGFMPQYTGYTIPPKQNANYAFILAGLQMADSKMAFLLPNSVLESNIREETDIRQQLVKDNLISAVIALPDSMFESTSIPTCIVLFDKRKETQRVEMIDLSEKYETEVRDQKGQFGSAGHVQRTYHKNVKILTAETMQKAMDAIRNGTNETGFSRSVLPETLSENEYSLSPRRYIEKEIIEEKHRSFEDIAEDYNRIIRQKNIIKIRMNRTAAKRLGYDCLAVDIPDLSKTFAVVGQKAEKEAFISFTADDGIRIECSTKDGIPTMIILFLKEWRTMIMHLNSEENRLLAEFRDALLPKLMSGEIRVNE